jgi:hypothetical protein
LARLEGRRPELYHGIYADIRRSTDLTLLFDLPRPGRLTVHALAAEAGPGLSPEQIINRLAEAERGEAEILILPTLPARDWSQEALARLAAEQHAAVFACLELASGESRMVLARPEGPDELPRQGSHGPIMVDYGPARIGLARPQELLHPEMTVAMSKLGCDLALASGRGWDESLQLMLKVKALDKLCVAGAFWQGALIAAPPEGHRHWDEYLAAAPGLCSHTMDTAAIRSEVFLDRLDFGLLLSQEPEQVMRHRMTYPG